MTKVDAPQYPTDKRKVVRSFNDDGSANFGQVGIEELSYRARFGATTQSSTENDISIGSKYFVLNDSETKFRVGDDILIICLDDPDCYMWGEIIGSDDSLPVVGRKQGGDLIGIAAFVMISRLKTDCTGLHGAL